jgi:hypothetical protein
MTVTAPLLTTGAPAVPSSAGFGILGNPSTQILFGQTDLDLGQLNGARMTIGAWLDGGYRPPGCTPIGVEASYFVLGRQATHFSASSDASGSPILARPVVDARTGAETALLISSPMAFGGSAGDFTANTASELWGAEANVFVPLVGKPNMMVGGLLGARFINFEEGLTINETSTVLPGGVAFFNGTPIVAPGQLSVSDSFQTRNNFYGGQVGVQTAFNYHRLTLTATGKIALGTIHQQVEINGQTTASVGGLSATTPGGLLALGTNSGGFGHYEFAIAPEGAVQLVFQVTDKIHLTAGYTFLYVNNVVRPGNLIDRNINPTQLPSSQVFSSTPPVPASPTFDFNRTEFWVQGITFGVGFTF